MKLSPKSLSGIKLLRLYNVIKKISNIDFLKIFRIQIKAEKIKINLDLTSV
jgi:hypothetical protein